MSDSIPGLERVELPAHAARELRKVPGQHAMIDQIAHTYLVATLATMGIDVDDRDVIVDADNAIALIGPKGIRLPKGMRATLGSVTELTEDELRKAITEGQATG